MSKRALEQALRELQALTANQLTSIIRDGIPTFDDEGNQTGTKPAPAPYFSAAITLLKNNGIEATDDEGGLKGLHAALDDEELPFADSRGSRIN